MKTKLKKQINIVDIVILIALLVLACASVFKIVSNITSSGDEQNIRYVLKVEPISSSFNSNVSEGDGVFEHTSGSQIGTVNAVSTAQAYHKGNDLQGAQVSSPIEGQSIMYITVDAKGTKTNVGYSIEDTLMGIGRSFEIRLPNLYCTAECISLEIVE